jgi:hypothetical protein
MSRCFFKDKATNRKIGKNCIVYVGGAGQAYVLFTWERCKDSMLKDILHRRRGSTDETVQLHRNRELCSMARAKG